MAIGDKGVNNVAEHGGESTSPVASIVVPTYNEADNIPVLLEALHEALVGRRFEILVVDDNSPDGTWRIAGEVADRLGSIRVIRRIEENGLSSAIIRGMEEALGDAICVIDADLQHDERVLPDMIDKVMAGADVCVGSRKAEGGGYGDWSMSRRFVSWGATVIAKTATGTRVTDPMSGFFAVRSTYFEVVAPELNPRGFKVLLELLARGEPNEIAEVGYVFRERTRGETKLSSGVVYEYLLGIVDLRLGRVVSSQSVTYLLVTLFGMGVNLVGYLLFRLFDVNRTVSAVVGFELAVLATYIGNNSFTFRAQGYRGSRWIRGLSFYQAVSLYGGLIQFGVFQTFRELPPFSLVAFGGTVSANALAILTASVATYMLHLRYTWSRLVVS